MDTAALSVIGSSLVGLGGLLVGAWGTRATVRAHAVERSADREHERLLARDARVFERRADAYEDVMRFSEMQMQMIESVYPVANPAPTAPNFPTDAEQEAMLRGRFSAYASREADEALGSFLLQALAFHLRAGIYERVKDQGPDAEASLKEVNEAREEARTRFGELKDRIRDDLAALETSAGRRRAHGAPALSIGHKSRSSAQIASNRPQMAGICDRDRNRRGAPVTA